MMHILSFQLLMLEWFITAFSFEKKLISFSLNYCFHFKFFSIWFLQFFLHKTLFSFLFSPFRSLITYVYGTVFSTFLITKFIFWCSNNITSFKSRIFIITFFTKVNIHISFNINRLHFNCARIFIAYIYYII